MELKAENVKNIRSLAVCKEILRQAIELNDQLNEELLHQKYKRCIAMAKWCKYWANYWECCEPPDCSLFITKAKYYRKWLDRWIKIAEQFKEAKCR